ncbi:DnaA protein [Litoreibacter ponti]|uniref:DnaA protein n=1 Tax=Litoreibacter ponti TaxID=1510457 RepID=A0A2T6BKP2_9RHOB|nr:DnaA/Hda family protein [Litoreibacter ponti]PTX56637.1 DnaA protein [Litoreibacter ponti]
MAEQLTFTLPAKVALGREDYFVSDANAVAVAVIEDWPNWPQGKLVLAAPSGAGKTHLAMVWAAEAGAQTAAARILADPETLATGPRVVEDIDQIAGNRAAETQLFHLHNLMAERGHPLLMTSAIAPARLELALPDLRSRLEATALASLDAPDDMLLTALVVKLFSDRQIALKPEVLSYALPRLPRSFAAARRFVERMDARALAEKKTPGRGLARAVLDEIADG